MLNLSLQGIEIKDAVNGKLLGVKIDRHLNWNSHIDNMITKLNSRVSLLKRAKKYLNKVAELDTFSNLNLNLNLNFR